MPRESINTISQTHRRKQSTHFYSWHTFFSFIYCPHTTYQNSQLPYSFSLSLSLHTHTHTHTHTVSWRRKWQPTPVFLPGEFHGQRKLVGYSPWSCQELDMTEGLTLSLSLSFSLYIFIYIHTHTYTVQGEAIPSTINEDFWGDREDCCWCC